MRSKIRWFTEFCNSHYVSHFAAFFIDTGAKISVVESCLWFVDGGARPPVRLLQFGLELVGWIRADPRPKPKALKPLPRRELLQVRFLADPQADSQWFAYWLWIVIDSMILPQVHLRKPCYDFSFL